MGRSIFPPLSLRVTPLNQVKPLNSKIKMMRSWTLKEEQILHKYYLKERTKGIRKRMPYRSKGSIHAKAYRMGMIVANYDRPSSFKRWSTRELKILEQFYPIEGVACVKRLPRLKGLKRSKAAVIAKAKELGLKTQPLWSSEEDAVLQQYYQSEGPDCYKRVPNRSKKATQQRANLLGLAAEKNPPWCEEEIDILKSHSSLSLEALQTLLPDRSKSAIENKRKLSYACGELTFTRQKQKWSEEEDAIVRQYYPTEGGKCDKYMPNRSRVAIRQRARFLGVCLTEKSDWSEGEEAIMRQYYLSEGPDCYERLPKRSRAAVQNRAVHLGLTVQNRLWSEKEIDILNKNFDLEIEELQTLLPGRTINAISKKLRKRSEAYGDLTPSKPKNCWSEEEDAILRQYYPIEGSKCEKRLPNRSRIAVERRAKHVGLVVLKSIRSKIPP